VPQAKSPLPYCTDFLFIYMGNPDRVGADLMPRGWLARLHQKLNPEG